MKYKNQLVQTGRLNDVGAYIRENVPDAYRLGVEMQAGFMLNNSLEVKANMALSANKIGSYTAFLDNYDENWHWLGQVSIPFNRTDLAFSPQIIGAAELKWFPFSDNSFFVENPLSFSWNAKYVSKQYLDNTGNEKNILPSFFVNDMSANFQIKKNMTLSGHIFNLFNERYVNNGWVYNSVLDGTLQSDIGVYPQAGRNYFISLDIGF
jgi:iron complex outermembrane receptor protein